MVMPPPLFQGSVSWLGYCWLLGGWSALLLWAVVRIRWVRRQGQLASPSPSRVAIRLLTVLSAFLAVVSAVTTSQALPDIAVLVAASATWIALALTSEAETALGAQEMGLCIRAGANCAALLVTTSWYASFAAAFEASSSELEGSRRRAVLGFWSVSLFLASILAVIGLRAPGVSNSTLHDPANTEPRAHVERGVIVDSADAGPPSPEPGASLLDLLTFGWMRPVLLAGRRGALEFKDIFELAPQDRCEANSAALATAWASEVDAAERSVDMNNPKPTAEVPSATAHQVALEANTSVLRTILVRCCGRRLLKLAALRAFAIVVTFAQPLALGAVISSVGAGSSSEPRGRRARLTFTYAALLFGLSFFSAVLDSHCSYAMQRLATQQRLGMQRFLFTKALKLSGSARQLLGTGAIVSHLQVDCRLVSQGVVFVHQIWSIPLQLAVCLTLLYQQLGVSAFAGLGVTVLMSPIMFFCARAARRARQFVMRRRDTRLKFLTELLQGARSLKLFAWEVQARDRVSAVRALEVEAIQATQLWSACTQGLANAIPLLVAVVTFATFSVLSSNDEDNSGDLTPSRAFVSLTLLGLLGAPLAKIPVFMTSVLGMIVAAQRLNTFLHAEEFAEIVIDDDFNQSDPERDDIQKSPLPASDGVFATARSPLFEVSSDVEASFSLEESITRPQVSVDGLSDARASDLLAKISAGTHETNDASLRARQHQYVRCLSLTSSEVSDAAVALAGGSPGAALAIGGPASFAWPAHLAEVSSNSSRKGRSGKGGKGGKEGKGGGKGGKGKGGKGGKGDGDGIGSRSGKGDKSDRKGRGKEAKDKDKEEKCRGNSSQRRQAVLRGVALSIPAGSLVAVVGRVGSGKSSLLAALLHELEATELGESRLRATEANKGQTEVTGQTRTQQGPPRVAVCGSVAYCAQEPWIQNTTLKDNVCFSRAFDPVRYATVIEACALQPDLQQLPSGDDTQIGERGLTLSGGQKARVALARALYVDADVFLLDDVLAAVDQHVQRHLLHHILLPPHGLLRHAAPITTDSSTSGAAPGFGVKTVVVVTNQLDWLSKADFVIALGGGSEGDGSGGDTEASGGDEDDASCVLAWGRPEELRERGVDVAALVRNDARKWAGVSLEAESVPDKVLVDDTAADASESTGDCTFSKSTLESIEKQADDNEHTILGAEEKSTSSQASVAKVDRSENEVVSTSTGDDIRLKGAVKTEIWAGYARALGVQWSGALFILYTAAQFSRTGGDLVIAYWSMATDNDDQVFFLTLYAAATGVAAAVVFLRAVALVFANLRASTKAHDRALWAILRSPMDFFDTTTSGRVLNRFSSDLQQVDMQLRALAASLLSSTFQLLAGLVVVAATVPPALLVLPPLACFYFKLQRDYRCSATEAQRLQSISRSPVLQQVSELIMGLTTVRAFRYAAVAKINMTTLIDRQARAIRCTNTLSRWLAFRLELLGSVVVLAVAISAAVTDATTTEGADAAIVGLSLSYALQFTSYLNGFLKSIADMELGLVAMERLHQYAQLPCEASLTLPQPPISNLTTNVNIEMVDLESSPNACFRNEGGVVYDPPSDWPKHGAVSFQGVSMRYRPGLPEVLRDLSFEASPGQHIGIVGRTGSGKSTILAALFRLPSIGLTSGRITIDSVDIAHVGLHTLRKRISIVPQDPVLLSGSLRDNLDPFDEYSDVELKSSLVAVGLWDALMQRNTASDSEKTSHVNRGRGRNDSSDAVNVFDWSVLEFAISSYGENLSVGQRQLLCIARALLRQCKVAVLDEATAAIDKATDELIQRTLTTALCGATVLTVAHRLDTIAQSDKVLVMDRGTAVEYGHSNDLLSDPNSQFYALWHGHKHKLKPT